MIKTRKAPLAAAVILILALLIAPLLSVNASANSVYIYEGVKKSSGTYKAALLDADFYDSPDGCLSSSEEASILNLMQETANKIECHVGIAIVSDLHGMSDVKYADTFGDKQFGTGSSFVVLMLLNTHGNPKYASYIDRISTSGLGRDYYDRKIEKLLDRMYDGLDTRGFGGACESFCAALKTYRSGSSGYSFGGSFRINGTLLMAMLGIGLLMSFIIVGSFRSGYKRKTPISAAHYIDKSRTRVNRQIDQFVREHTTSVHIDSSSHSGGGGHHGGGGGSHRSGGHGGGGGRHR